MFGALGRELELAWRAANHDERAFPALAASHLAHRVPELGATPASLLDLVLRADALPAQLDPESKFGQPAITLFRAPRFVIDALFWLEGATDIHQHGFAGAFHVLAGSSMHTEYDWRLDDRVSASILVGEVSFRGFELLTAGDTREIHPGNALVHALFHLERPSVTIVARTIRDLEHGPQYRYCPPTLAIDPFALEADEPLLRRKLEAMTALQRIAPDAYEAALAPLFAEADFFSLYHLAEHHFNRIGGERLRELLERARPKQGARVDAIWPALEEQARLRAISSRRTTLVDPDHRFFLAVLLNLPTRDAIFDAVSARYHDHDPAERLAGWVCDLADSFSMRAAGDGDASAVVITEMLRGATGDELLARLEAEHDIDGVRDDIRDLDGSLRRSPFLRSLF